MCADFADVLLDEREFGAGKGTKQSDVPGELVEMGREMCFPEDCEESMEVLGQL